MISLFLAGLKENTSDRLLRIFPHPLFLGRLIVLSTVQAQRELLPLRVCGWEFVLLKEIMVYAYS